MVRRPTALLLAFLAIPWVAEGQFHALSKGVDINNAVNVSQFVLIDWTNTGKTNVVAIDPLKRQLVLSTATSGSVQAATLAKVLEGDLPNDCKLLVADIDSHKGNDLLLISGSQVRAWTSGQRLAPTSPGPDLIFELPVPAVTWATDTKIADFDQDGSPDLLMAESYNYDGDQSIGAPYVVFSLGKPSQSVIQVTSLSGGKTKVGAAWQTGGPPTLVTTGSGETPITRVSQFSQDREWSETANFSGGGELVDLDGISPPERVNFTYAPASSFPVESLVTVERYDGIQWLLADSVSLGPAESSYWRDLGTLCLDFEGNGRQELVITAQETLINSPLPHYGAWVLAYSPGSGFSVNQLTSGSDIYYSFSAVDFATFRGQGLSLIHPSSPSLDLFGNPVSVYGLGIRAKFLTYSAAHGSYVENVLAPAAPNLVAYGRFDSDSHSDLMVIAKERPSKLFRGPLEFGQSIPAPSSLWSIGGDQIPYLQADMNNDGSLDLVSSNGNYVQTLVSRTIAGQYDQTAKTSFTLSGNNFVATSQLLGAADFDGDGDVDPLFLNGRDELLSWLENRNGGDLAAEHVISLAGKVTFRGDSTHHLIGKDQTLIIDADQDGDPDIFTVPSALGNRLGLHRNMGNGQFALEAPAVSLEGVIGTTTNPAAMAILRSGRFLSSTDPIQVAVIAPIFDSRGDYRMTVSLISGTAGNLNVSQPFESPHLASVIVADFDGDGLDDLISYEGWRSDLFGNPSGSTRINLQRSRGDGTFDPSVAITEALGFISDMIAIDHDNDGSMDLIAASKETGTVEVFSHQMVAPLPTYDSWLESHGLIASGSSGDPDHDGKANLMEYVTGQDPHGIASPPGAPAPAYTEMWSPGSATLWASHPRPRAEGEPQWRIILEASTDLQNWIQADEPRVQVDPLNPQWEILSWGSASFDVGEHTSFFHRFRVERIAR